MNRKARRILKSIGIGKEEKPSPETIQTDYLRACAEAGELQYKIGEFQSQLVELNTRLQKLNRAYAEVQAEQRAASGSKKEESSASSSNLNSGVPDETKD
jgi:hypothetical protein